MPDLPQNSSENLEDAEVRYAITLSKEMQHKVRGRVCAHMTFQPAMNLSVCQLYLLKHKS